MSSKKTPLWTKDEELTLIYYWGYRKIEDIALKIGRSKCAVINKAKRMNLGPPCQTAYTIAHLHKLTGVDTRRIKKVLFELDPNPRTKSWIYGTKSKKTHYFISEDLAEQITAKFGMSILG